MLKDKLVAAERYFHAQRLRDRTEGTAIGPYKESAASRAQRRAERAGVPKPVIRALNVIAQRTVRNSK